MALLRTADCRSDVELSSARDYRGWLGLLKRFRSHRNSISVTALHFSMRGLAFVDPVRSMQLPASPTSDLVNYVAQKTP
jgi:hypothetical protein